MYLILVNSMNLYLKKDKDVSLFYILITIKYNLLITTIFKKKYIYVFIR